MDFSTFSLQIEGTTFQRRQCICSFDECNGDEIEAEQLAEWKDQALKEFKGQDKKESDSSRSYFGAFIGMITNTLADFGILERGMLSKDKFLQNLSVDFDNLYYLLSAFASLRLLIAFTQVFTRKSISII